MSIVPRLRKPDLEGSGQGGLWPATSRSQAPWHVLSLQTDSWNYERLCDLPQIIDLSGRWFSDSMANFFRDMSPQDFLVTEVNGDPLK